MATKAGGYFEKYFDGFSTHLGGAAGDWMLGRRIRNMVVIMQKTDALLATAGLSSNYKKISERNAIPLIEAISIESDEGIQTMWAAYIKNALRGSHTRGVERHLIRLIGQLEPADLPVIEVLLKQPLSTPVKTPIVLGVEDFNSVGEAELTQSLDRLAAAGLFSHDNDVSHFVTLGSAASIAPCKLKVATETAWHTATNLLLTFQEAVR